MSKVQDERDHVGPLADACCGERIAAFPPARRCEIHRLSGNVMWWEEIEAPTQANVDAIIAYAAEHPAQAA